MTQQIEELLSSLGSGSLKEQHQARMKIIEIGSDNGTLPNYGLKADTNREKVNKAVRELLSLGKANSDYTESELELLRQYSGQGGLKQNSQYEYYTPTKIAAGMWDALKLHGYSGGNFLEPSVGAGVYLATKPENSIGTAVEIDPTSSKVAQILNPGDSVTNQSFEELCINTPAGIYDAAIGNVPFGDVRGKWANKDKAHKHISDIEIYFLLRMADKVRQGGLIAVVVPSRVVSNKDKKWQAFRAEMSMKAEFLGAHRMPSKEFAKQGATVITDVVIFKKHAKEITGFPNETLENAKVLWDTFIGGHWFEKDGKRYVHGDFVPKEVGDRYGRDQVVSAAPFDAKKLSVKFDSRIDWDLLQINPEDMPVYVTGDKRIINGDMHVFTGQEWMKAELTEAEKEAKNIFAQPIEALKSNKSIAELFEMRGLLPKNIQDAMDYAMKQKIQYRDAVFRGILMGMAIENAETNQVGQGDINQMVLDEVALHGNPHNIKGLSTFSGASRDFGRYMGMIDPNTGDIRTKTVSERVENFNRDNPQSIVIFLSENGGSVNLEQLNDLYSGMPLSLQDIAKMPNLAITPDGKIMELEAYCSGDAVRKSLDINLALADETDPDIRAAYYRQLERIEAKREYAKLENINLTLQTAWLDSKYMTEFLRSIGYSYANPGKGSQLRPLEGSYGANGFEKWLVNRLSGNPTSGGSRNQEYLDRFAGLNDRFADFMRSHADAKDVETDYNNLFLSEIPQTFSESPLGLENINPGRVPHNYQNATVRRLSAQGGGLMSLDVGLGKAQPMDCKILTNNGWVNMGDIAIGDKVFTETGELSNVVAIYPQGKKDSFLVTFSDGTATRCSEDHLWLTIEERDRQKKRAKTRSGINAEALGSVKSLSDIEKTLLIGKSQKNHQVPMVRPINFETKDLFIDPYTMGFLLGDGCFASESSVTFTSNDADVVGHISDFCLNNELFLSFSQSKSTISNRISSGNTGGKIKNTVLNEVRALGLSGCKSESLFIPEKYLLSSVKQRISLLQGLMDSDGYIAKDGMAIQYYSVSGRLRDGVIGLVQSLGGTATFKQKKTSFVYKGERKKGQDVFIVSIRLPNDIEPFRLERKKSRVVAHNKYTPCRFIVGVEKIGSEEMQCIAIDSPTHLYVTDSYIVTHNTFSALLLHEFDKKMKRTSRTCITVPDNVLVNWFREHEQTYVDGSKTLFVGLSVSDEKEPVLDGDGNPTGKMQYVVKKASKDVFKQLHTIPTSAYDLVIMSNEVFQRIPIKTETIEQQAGIMKDDNRLTDKEKISYAEAVEKNRKEQQATDEGTNKKAEWPFFEDLGFTKVISDEMHSYKNSYTVSGKLSRLAYLPTPKPSQRSLDMAIKSGYIRHKFGGKGVIGLTATPIVNSPLEVYSMLSLVVDPQEFRRLGIFSPDDFVNQFAKIGTVEKLRVNNTIDLVDGVTGFMDLQSLRALFKKYAISLDAEDVGLELPDADRQEIAVDLDDEQEVEYDLLLDEYKEMREANDKTQVRSIFSIIRDMERVTMGVDVFKRQIRFVFGHDVDIDTIRKAVESLPKSAKAGDGEDDYLKGEDVDVSLKFNVQAQDNGTVVTLPDAFEKPFVAALKKLKVEESSFTHPISPKIAALLERVAAELAIKSKQVIFTEEVAAHSQLRRIIGKSLPITLGKVGIINAKEADSTKIQEISDNYNTGSMLIVIANRKAEVGVNLQVGTGAIHHYDYPWTPAAMKQRNGRGLRQGNKSKAVRIYCYKANGTFDQYRLNLLAVKDEILSSVMEGNEAEAENQDSAKFSADDLEILTSKNPEEAKAKMEAARNKAYAAKKAKDDYAARMALGRIMQIRAKKAEFVLQYGHSAAGAPKYEAKLAEFDKKAATEIDYLTERDKQGKNPFDVKAALADQGTFVAGNVVLIPGCFYRIKEPSIPGTPKEIKEFSKDYDFKFISARSKSYRESYTTLNFVSLQNSEVLAEFRSTAIHDIVFEQTFPDVLGEELNKYKQNPVTNDDYQKLSDELFDKLKGVATLANCAVFYNEDGQLKAKMFSGVMPDNAVRMFGGIKSRKDGSAEDRDRQFARWHFKEGSSMSYDQGGLSYKMMEQYFGYRYDDYFKTLLNCIDEPGTAKTVVDYIDSLQFTQEQIDSGMGDTDMHPHTSAIIESIQKTYDNSRSELNYWISNQIRSLYESKFAAIVKASRSTSLRDLLANPKVKLLDNIVKAFADIGVMVFVNPVTIGKTEEWKSIFMLFNNDNVFANHFDNDWKSDVSRERGSKSDNAVIGMWPFSDYDRYYQFNKPVNIVNLGLVYKRMVGTTMGKAGDKVVAETKAKVRSEVPVEGREEAFKLLRMVVDWRSSEKYRNQKEPTDDQKADWQDELTNELDEWLIRYAPVDWQTNKDRLRGVMRKIQKYGKIYNEERITDAFTSYPRYK